MKLKKEDIEKVAWLARLDIDDAEKERLTGDLNQIMKHFEKLQQLDTDLIEPTSHSHPIVNVFREDIPGSSLDVKDAIANAPQEDNGYFVVPQVVEI